MSLSDALEDRLSFDPKSLFQKGVKEAIIAQIDAHRKLLQYDKNLFDIEEAISQRIDFFAQTIVEEIETLLAAQHHRRETIEGRQDLIHSQSNALTPLINFDEYLQKHPDTIAWVINNMSPEALERALKGVPKEKIDHIRSIIE